MGYEKQASVFLGGAWPADGGSKLEFCGLYAVPAGPDDKGDFLIKGAGDRVVGRMWKGKHERGPVFSGFLGKARVVFWLSKSTNEKAPKYLVNVEPTREERDEQPNAAEFQDDDIPFG